MSGLPESGPHHDMSHECPLADTSAALAARPYKLEICGTTFVQGRVPAFPEIVRLIISKDAARRHHQRPPHAFRLELK